jgi:hypothetical protein
LNVKKERVKVALRVLARLYDGRPDPGDIGRLRSWAPAEVCHKEIDDVARFIIFEAEAGLR